MCIVSCDTWFPFLLFLLLLFSSCDLGLINTGSINTHHTNILVLFHIYLRKCILTKTRKLGMFSIDLSRFSFELNQSPFSWYIVLGNWIWFWCRIGDLFMRFDFIVRNWSAWAKSEVIRMAHVIWERWGYICQSNL